LANREKPLATAVEDNQPEAKKKDERKETTLEFIASMASVLVTGLFIITFTIQAFEIPTSSMENTLLIGDHVFVDRIAYAPRAGWMPVLPYRDIKRGDIFVFLSPAQPGLFLVKRVIGIPGDRIHLREGVVYLNGVAQNETYVIHSMQNYMPYRDEFPSAPPPEGAITPEWHLTLASHIENGDLVVPPNSYFAMGDNRDVSYDSRFWGFVPRENVIGRPLFVYWSFETPRDQWQKTDFGSRIAFMGRVVIHFFDETRWRRMFRVVH